MYKSATQQLCCYAGLFYIQWACSKLCTFRALAGLKPHFRRGAEEWKWGFSPAKALKKERYKHATLLLCFFCGTAFGQPTIESGKAVFAQHCWFCHGQQGDGNSDAAAVLKPKPRDFTNPKIAKELTLERIIQSITAGRPKTAMPAFGFTLTPGEIQSVAHYIKKVIMQGTRIDRFYKGQFQSDHDTNQPEILPATLPHG